MTNQDIQKLVKPLVNKLMFGIIQFFKNNSELPTIELKNKWEVFTLQKNFNIFNYSKLTSIMRQIQYLILGIFKSILTFSVSQKSALFRKRFHCN